MGVKYLERKSRNQRTIGFGSLENVVKEINRFHERTGKETMVFFVTSSSKDPENPPRDKLELVHSQFSGLGLD
jgi:hypothetical protein